MQWKAVGRLTWAQRNPNDGENCMRDSSEDYKGKGAGDQSVFPGNGIYPVYQTVTPVLNVNPFFTQKNDRTLSQLLFGRRQ
jgi:hypothetical protein